MTPNQIKEGYISLPPKARREVALWMIQREFSEKPVSDDEDPAGAVQAALRRGSVSGGVSTRPSPSGNFALKILAVVLVGCLAVAIFVIWEQNQKTAGGAGEPARPVTITAKEQEQVAALEAREASRPRSPTNLDYLEDRIGLEVTLRGIPKRSEVGYLYFHEDPEKGVRVKLISGGVVVYQSTDLEAWVEKEQELEVRGTLVRNEDGLLEIPVDRQVQVKIVGEQTVTEESATSGEDSSD